ncbi:MAG: hypothetical protein H6581_31295 [Bacteroidia bacterium]|nr:hypothetical protein [Bacteroidia bacterium]
MILSVLLFTSCFFKPDRKAAEIKVDDRFAIEIPSSFVPQNDMHDFAGLQYAHEDKPLFILGITEPKNDLRKLKLRFSLEDYAHFAVRNLGNGFYWHHVSDTNSYQINGVNCFLTHMEALSCQGRSQNEIAYEVAVFDGNEFYTQLIAWAPLADKNDLHEEMTSIIRSFRDISHPDPNETNPAYMGNPAGSIEDGSGS